MPVWDWITRRMEATGWESWNAVARAAGLSREDQLNLREVDDLLVLRRQQVCDLAAALCTTAKQLRRLDDGEIVDTPLRDDVDRRALAVRLMADGDDADWWRPPPADATPVVGSTGPSGHVELVNLDGCEGDEGAPLPGGFGTRGTVFALRVWPGVRWSVYRIVSSTRFRDGEDVAVYLYNECDGEGYVGRVTVVGSRVTLRRPDNQVVEVDAHRVARLAKEIATWPPPLGRPEHSDREPIVAAAPDKMDYFQMFAGMMNVNRLKEDPMPEHPYGELDSFGREG